MLDYLANRDSAREQSLRGATQVSRAVLSGMVRKKWIAREDQSDAQDAARTVKVAVLAAGRFAAGSRGRCATRRRRPSARLQEAQRQPADADRHIGCAGGRAPVETLQSLDIPRTTLGTLVRRGLVDIVEEPAGFHVSRVKARPSPFDFEFNPAQKQALQRIVENVEARKFAGMLLHGVTGSGKTAVYLAGMRAVLEAGRSAILLVPEIGLTPAVAADLHQVFGEEVAILHSALSDQERAEQWHRIKRGEARMVVGTRSAVFAPVADLALIIVDEEQDSSYKQEETPRYHARDVAVMRAKMAGAAVVLGSATPSLESYYNAKKNKYALVELPDRVEQRPLPEVELIDMRQEFQETGQEQVISRKLAEEIRDRLERKEQVMILLNRRGYSPVALCRACGKTLECKNCAIAMTHHKTRAQDGMPLLRIRRARSREVRAVWQRVRVFPRHRVGEAGRIAARHVSHGAHRPARSRYGSRQGRFRARAECPERRRTRSAGRHADDRQGTRCSRRDAGRRGRSRHRAGTARLPRRRTNVSSC